MRGNASMIGGAEKFFDRVDYFRREGQVGIRIGRQIGS
jgi:hypothetical protein